MKKLNFLWFVIFLNIFSLPAFSICDSCLYLLPNEPSKNIINPDSIMIDTCYNEAYAKNWFSVNFYVDVFHIPKYDNPDTIIERTWDNIDTNYADIRSAFQELKNKVLVTNYR